MRLTLCAAAAGMMLTAFPALAQTVPVGVYDCYGRGMAEGDRKRDTAGQLDLGGSKFSVIGAGQYLSHGVTTGHFRFDGLILAMIDGPYAGQRFQKVADFWSFRLLRASGEMGPVSCPLNTAKDARRPNGW